MFTVNLDENKYILSISHTKNDNVEIDLSMMDLRYLNAYRLVNSEVILDENRKSELIAEEEERARKEAEPTREDRLEAQTLYTAMMTDTLLEE